MRTAVQVVSGLLVASHLGPTLVVTALSVVLLVGLGAPTGTVVLAGAAVLAGQFSVGWSNDWLDASRDRSVDRREKPVVAGILSVADLRLAAWSAAVVCGVLSWATGPVAGSVHVGAVASAWAYNAGLKRTPWSWLPYAVSFGALPAFLVLASGRGAPPAWLVLAGALLGVGAHVANVLPDLAEDAATGVRGLPHRAGRTLSSIAAPVLLTAAVAVIVAGPPGSAGAWRVVAGALAVGLAVVAGAAGAARPRSRAPFALSMAVAGVCVVLLATAGPTVAA